MYCYDCGQNYTDRPNIEAIEDFGKCLGCDHIEGEIILNQGEELYANH